MMMQNIIIFITWYVCLAAAKLQPGENSIHNYRGFDDTVLFNLKWPGRTQEVLDATTNHEALVVTTHNKEKYKCMLPNIEKEEGEKTTAYTGPAPLDLVSTLFSSSTCSYRVETYWTYEVCHGSYIKQYHEDREGKTIKVHEYILGKWDKQKTNDLKEKIADGDKESEKLKTVRIEGVNMPYFEIEMSDGTFCDLSGESRTTRVLYVCYPDGKNEVFSIKETSTCNYDVIILTPTLCIHPNFNQKGSVDNTINCIPYENSPNKPKSLLMMEVENMKKILDMSKDFSRQRVTVVKLGTKDGTLKAEIVNDEYLPALSKAVAEAASEDRTPILTTKHNFTPSKLDASPIIDFLSGKHCLTGGTGWWKYEFCYGRHVRQFHMDKNGETSIMLGYFDENEHKKWLATHPIKRPIREGSRAQLIHFYQGGSKCDITGEQRQTEVQLRCPENSSSMTKVSLYLMEPRTCQYILNVETALICDIIHKADENGLVPSITHDSSSVEVDEEVSDADTSNDVDHEVDENE